MNWSSRQVREASFWQFHAAADGWRRANSTEEDHILSEAEIDHLAAHLDLPPVWQ